MEIGLGAQVQDGIVLSGAVDRSPYLALESRPVYELNKRILDAVASAIALIVGLPIIIAIAIAIRIDSPGPIIFRQRRVAQGGGTFYFYKFRTMWMDARERFPALYAYQYSEEEFADLLFCKAGDPRTTRLGKWLRTTSLDELPNLFNVLIGNMSLVGPRPEIPDLLPYYKGEQLAKFAVKPGVTCVWQVSGRDLLRRREGIALDLEYVQRRGFLFDLSILFKTLVAVVTRTGAF